MNRGSKATTLMVIFVPPSFNEAPIHESGKFDKGAGVPRRTECFNEAPIHESGKSDLLSKHVRAVRASMRPRFMNRGSPTRPGPRTPRRRRFNEAPIHESGKWSRMC